MSCDSLRKCCYVSITLLGGAISLALLPERAFGHAIATHRRLTVSTGGVPIRNIVFYTSEHSGSVGDMEQGSEDEDNGTRPLGHFYNPATGDSFIRGPATDNAQAQWSAACERYHNDMFSGDVGAFHSLGRTLHFIQDMTSPAHVHLVAHPFGQDFEDWGPDHIGGYSFIGVAPRFPANLTAAGFVHEVATFTYNLTAYQVELHEAVDPQLNSELQRMFPSLHWDDGGFFGDGFWTIEDIGDFENEFHFSNDWWVVNEGRTIDHMGPDGSRRVLGNAYIENTGGMASEPVPLEFNGVPNAARKTLHELYGDNLYPIAVGYGAGLLQLFSTKLDLIFTIDTTGSMFDDIAAVKDAATDIVEEIASTLCLYRVAIVSYEDFPVCDGSNVEACSYCDSCCCGTAACGDATFHDVLAFTHEKAEIVDGIRNLSLRCGADFAESVYSSLMHSISLPWRGANPGECAECLVKGIILMGDAPGHDPEPFTGLTAGDVIAAAEAVDPAQIFPIIIGFSSAARDQFEALAEGTNGELFEAASARDVVAAVIEAFTTIVAPTNNPPVCTFATARPGQIWPLTQLMVPIEIVGVQDPDGDPVSTVVTSITQDEPVKGWGTGPFAPDGLGVGTAAASVRAERSGIGNGRIYQVEFVADDGNGGSCAGAVLVSVAHDQGANSVAVDDGQNYDSTTGP